LKKILTCSSLTIILLVLLLISGCNKEDSSTAPKVTTIAATSIRTTTAICGGEITSIGGSVITEQGVCLSTSANPTVSDLKKLDSSGLRAFTTSVSGLSAGTTYHFRAFATNSIGVSYGEDMSFTTQTTSTITTNEISTITISGAVCGGVITSDGGAIITGKGVCWSISAEPTISGSKTTNGTGSDAFVSNITGLMAGTVYHVRAYATNAAGTSYGEDKSFTTTAVTMTTTAITEISLTGAVSGGTITSDGGATITAKGVCWSISADPTISNSKTSDGTGSASYVSTITSLSAGTTYHVRAYATYSNGTSYGEDITFTTSKTTSTISTSPVSSLSMTTATIGGVITSDGGAAITAKGVCWSISANPTISDLFTTNGTGSANFSSFITELTPNTTYHVRAYATNSEGIAYGNDVEFTTLATPPDNDNMLLGNPSGALPSILSPTNYLMVKPQYTLSYSTAKLTSNWVSWHLYSGDIGSTDRQDDFRADITLPSDWIQITTSNYTGSGFDRGHMCPSADRTLTIADNSATFLMTNMIPQAANNNQGPWATLENECRSLLPGNELYILSGPYGKGGTGVNGYVETFSYGVVVPSKTWKIIVVIPNGNGDLNRISTDTRVIAVLIPNDNNVVSMSSPWRNYRVSVDEIESLTGYDFLSNVSTSIQAEIEAKVDNL